MLTRRVSQHFPRAVRERGEEYFFEGRVRIVRGGAAEVVATVHGSRLHHVGLRSVQGCLEIECGCPFFEENGVCKHIWATVLAIDMSPHLERLKRGHGELQILAGGLDDDDFDEDDDDFDDGEDDMDDDDRSPSWTGSARAVPRTPAPPRSKVAAKGRVDRPAPAPRVPEWSSVVGS